MRIDVLAHGYSCFPDIAIELDSLTTRVVPILLFGPFLHLDKYLAERGSSGGKKIWRLGVHLASGRRCNRVNGTDVNMVAQSGVKLSRLPAEEEQILTVAGSQSERCQSMGYSGPFCWFLSAPIFSVHWRCEGDEAGIA